MSQSVESASSTLITGSVDFEREYFDDIPMPGGRTLRLQSLTYGELKKCVSVEAGHHFVAAVCLAAVDEKGDTIFAFSPTQFANFENMPSKIVEAMIEAVKAYVLNSIDYEALAKNS